MDNVQEISNYKLCWIWGSHSDGYEALSLVGYNTM